MKTKKTVSMIAALALCVLATQANADTLAKIKKNGSITLGHREASIPFSYYDGKQEVVGYSRDFQMKIVEAIKQKLELPNLQIQNMPVTSQNRIPLVQNATVDIECGSTTNNLERQKQIAFSNTIFVVGTRLLTRKESGIKDFADLKGKTVVTTAGTTSERLLRKLNNDQSMGMAIISTKDHGESLLTLETGRAVAYMNDDALLAGAAANTRNPKDWVIVGTPQSEEAYGCMIRKDDLAFKKVVDDAIAQVQKSGEAAKLYAKWFESPIPPKGQNLNFPMSVGMKKLYANPNDSALE